MEQVITARGHGHVRATHGSTLEVTTEGTLTPAGDCIVGIDADVAPAGFDPAFSAACRSADATIEAHLAVGELTTTVRGHGGEALTLADPTSAVLRTSEYVDDRTVMVGADRAAGDLDRAMVRELRGGAPVTMSLRVDP